MKTANKVLTGVLLGLLVVSVGVACDRLFHENDMMEDEFEEVLRQNSSEHSELGANPRGLVGIDSVTGEYVPDTGDIGNVQNYLEGYNQDSASKQAALNDLAALRDHYSSEASYYDGMTMDEWQNWDKNGDGIQDWDLDGNGVYDPNVDNVQYDAADLHVINGVTYKGLIIMDSPDKKQGLVNNLNRALAGMEALIAQLEQSWGLTADGSNGSLAWENPVGPTQEPQPSDAPDQGPSQYTPGNNTIELIEDK